MDWPADNVALYYTNFGDPRREPLGPLLDIPVERESIGAMSLVFWQPREEKPFKPYVYRGTGEDQFPETMEPPPPPKPKRKKRKPKTERQKDEAWLAHERRYSRRWGRPPAYRDTVTVQTVLDPPSPPPLPVMLPEVDDEYEPPPPPRLLRPAEGWRAMTGSDIDELLAEFGE